MSAVQNGGDLGDQLGRSGLQAGLTAYRPSSVLWYRDLFCRFLHLIVTLLSWFPSHFAVRTRSPDNCPNIINERKSWLFWLKKLENQIKILHVMLSSLARSNPRPYLHYISPCSSFSLICSLNLSRFLRLFRFINYYVRSTISKTRKRYIAFYVCFFLLEIWYNWYIYNQILFNTI